MTYHLHYDFKTDTNITFFTSPSTLLYTNGEFTQDGNTVSMLGALSCVGLDSRLAKAFLNRRVQTTPPYPSTTALGPGYPSITQRVSPAEGPKACYSCTCRTLV